MTERAGRVAETHSASIRGAHVRIRVQGHGEPLLLINGAARPLESWEPFARALPGRMLVSFDMPGAGLSPTPLWPLSIRALARIAGSVLDEVGLAGADVLGFSFGGAVAQQLAVQHPGTVHRLVLAATSCGVGATPGSGDVLDLLRRPAEARWPRPDPLGTLWHSLAISTWSSISFLGAIRVPALVVCGSHDDMAPPVNSELIARRIPGAELVMLSAGHDLQRTGPARDLAGAVEAFLGRSGGRFQAASVA